MRKGLYGLAAVFMAIGVLALVLVAYSHIHRPSVPEAVTFEVSDRPLLTLEQQRELVESREPISDDLKPYMWGYPE